MLQDSLGEEGRDLHGLDKYFDKGWIGTGILDKRWVGIWI
jgi:hypothetical protein